MTRGRVKASERKMASGVSDLIVAAATPKRRMAWCGGCRRGTPLSPGAIQYRTTLEQLVPKRLPVGACRSRVDRCPHTSSVGSRRSESCRRDGERNQSGCSLTQGWSGEAWKAMSIATSMPRDGASFNKAPELLESAERGVDRRVAPSRRRRWPTGCPGRSVSPATAPVAPLRPVRPIGWIGGRYKTSKPICCDVIQAVTHVGEGAVAPATGEAERGNISYQVLNRAFGGSTATLKDLRVRRLPSLCELAHESPSARRRRRPPHWPLLVPVGPRLLAALPAQALPLWSRALEVASRPTASSAAIPTT